MCIMKKINLFVFYDNGFFVTVSNTVPFEYIP